MPAKQVAPQAHASIGWPYQVALLLVIVGLQSIPRFLFEVGHDLQVVQRAILLVLFFVVAWFFTFSQHEPFNWNVLSGLFMLEMGVGVTLAVLLFLQLYSPYFVYATMLVLFVRAGLYSYIVSRKQTHLRTLVFCTGFFLLVAGELILILSRLPA